MSREELPVAEFAFPGPLRDQLVAAILSGGKTTTTGLLADYEREGEPLPRPGLRQAVVDSAGHQASGRSTSSAAGRSRATVPPDAGLPAQALV